MAFTENLRRLRLDQFLSQAELARRAGLHALTITRLEAGTTAPSTRTVRALADALGVEAREGVRGNACNFRFRPCHEELIIASKRSYRIPNRGPKDWPIDGYRDALK